MADGKTFDPGRYLTKVGSADYRGHAFGESPFKGFHELCPDCDGTGADDERLSCLRCGGWGYVMLNDGEIDA